MMNIKEKDFRHIEQIEEDLMRKLFSTDMSCPIHFMYLEAGQTPARFQIKRMILIFYQYILQQKEESMMFQMLAAQITNPTKNDFNETVNNIFKEFEISYSINEIKNMKKSILKNLIKKKCITASYEYLVRKQKGGSKGRLIEYSYEAVI